MRRAVANGPAHSDHLLVPVRIDSLKKVKEIFKKQGKCHRVRIEIKGLLKKIKS